MIIVGICGRARAGKDTLGKMLSDSLYDKTGKRFILMAYASELKRRVQRDFDLSYDQLWGDKKEAYDKRYMKRTSSVLIRSASSELPANYWTAREIMQNYGEFFRTIDYNFWVKELFRIISDKEYDNVIVTDVRHPNEARPIKEKGGLCVRVVRNTSTDVHNQSHISEIAMNDYKEDYLVTNYGSLDDLANEANKLADFILKHYKQGEK